MSVEERYVVTKVRTVEGMSFFIFMSVYNTVTRTFFLGFYGVTYYIGFRDEFDVKVGIKLFFYYFDRGLIPH